MGCWISHDLLQVFCVFWNANFQISTPNHMKWHRFWTQLEVDFAGWFFRWSSVILLSNLGGRKMNVASPPNKHPFGVGKTSLTKSGLPERKMFQNLKQHLTNYCYTPIAAVVIIENFFFWVPPEFPAISKNSVITKRFPSPSNNPLVRLVGRPWLRFPKAMSRQLHVQNSNL